METRFAFLGVYGSATGQAGLCGGVMVTDLRGVPLEIHVAESIRASVLQRRAYGEMLQRHAICDLVSTPLLAALDTHTDFVFVNHLRCLDAASSYPLMFMTEAEHLPSEITGEFSVATTAPVADQAQLAIVHPTSTDQRVVKAAIEEIAIAQRSFEPLGVFERLEGVMNLLSENDDQSV